MTAGPALRSAASTRLLECPDCRAGTLALSEPDLACEGCGHRFPVRDGVGCFVRTVDDYTENYDQIAADDLSEPKTPPAVKQIFTQLVQERARGVVCDLGCGDGYVIQRLGDRGQRIAVDLAFAYLELLPGEIAALWSTVEDVPLRSGSIDTILCTDVIEHVLDATLLAREIDRLLAPDGQALLAFPFEQDLGVYDLPEYRAKYGKYKYVHVRSITDALVADLFSGFEVRFEHLITEGMAAMDFKPYPIKFVELGRRA